MSLKKLAELATKLDEAGRTKAASLVDAALAKIAQSFPDDLPDDDDDDDDDESEDYFSDEKFLEEDQMPTLTGPYGVDPNEEDWDDIEPSTEELKRMEEDPSYEPFAEELSDAKKSRIEAIMLEMDLFTEALKSGKLTDEDMENWENIKDEFAEIMSAALGGDSTPEA